ncbi:reverse transcriptase domain-containing protein [Tanacetum coccineum]
MLTAPKEKRGANHVLGCGQEAISAVLMTERGDKLMQVYFVSRTLRGPEINYTPMEKLVLALLSASRRLKRYFQVHTVVVITDQPIKQLLSNSKISGRMLKWKFKLEGYDIQYRPKTSVKGQILADFIVERPEEASSDELHAEPEMTTEPGLCLRTDHLVFEATNNEAEYEALLAGLWIAKQMGVKNLQTNMDSRLVANQVNGSYVVKELGMVQYLEKVKTLASNFKEFSIKQVPQSENKKADALSNIASTSFAHLSKEVLVEELKEKSINEKEVLAVVEEDGYTWMTPICEYLTKEILSEDKKKARVVRRKASRYAAINGTLYKKYFLGPWLRCVRPLQANYVLREIHEGSCSMHSGPRFGLPGEIVSDNGKQFCENPFKDWCEKLCIRQCFASVKHPQTNGLVERALAVVEEDGYTWMTPICEYLTKEILSEDKKKARVVRRKASRYAAINGTLYKKYFLGPWLRCVRPLQANYVLREIHEGSCSMHSGPRANRSLGEGIKARLDGKECKGLDAVIPAEIGMPTLRTAKVDLIKNGEALEINLDLIEEKGEQVAIQEAKSKAKMEKYYNSKVRGTSFRPGDMVYRSNDASHAKDGGKLGPNWEGPYEVTESLGKGAYKLKERNGNELPRTWNICNLKKCYIHEV